MLTKRRERGIESGKTLKRRLGVVVGLVVLNTAAVFVPSAAAIPPLKESVSFPDTFTVEDICTFPVTITSTFNGTQTTFFDQSGAVTRIHIHAVEQDTFSANGHTLTGIPFTFNIEVLFEDGEVTHVYASGLVEKVPLPDGSVFLSAGRVDFVAHPGADFRIVPDVGRSGDVAAFCAALSP
jgi:hypothetical protein